jgi:DNA repair photolyase
MEFDKQLQVGNIKSVERKLDKIFNKGEIKPENFLDVLISEGYDWHCGGMSDPFQPAEKKFQITKQLLNVTNKYGIHILFSTKSDTTYDCDIKPDLHTFQFLLQMLITVQMLNQMSHLLKRDINSINL